MSQRKLDFKHESITNSAMRFSVEGLDDPVAWWNVPYLKEKYGAGNKKGKTQRKCEVCHRDTVYVCRCCSDFNRFIWVCQPVDDRNGQVGNKRAERFREQYGLAVDTAVAMKDINRCWLHHSNTDPTYNVQGTSSERELSSYISSSDEESDSEGDE